MYDRGEQVFGVAHSTDATVTEIVLYKMADDTQRVIQSDETLKISDVMLVSAVGGDCAIQFGNAAISAPKTVVRGTFDTNGGIGTDFDVARQGMAGEKPYLRGSAGVNDAVIHGVITKG